MYPIPHRHRTRQQQIQIIYCTDSCTLYSPAFLHMTVLCYLQSPPPGKYIHGGRSGEGRGKKEEKSTTCEQQNIFFLFYTWPKTINAATSLLYCRFVHGTVHLLYCINTHTLITVFTVYFYIFNYWVNPASYMVEDQPAVL